MPPRVKYPKFQSAALSSPPSHTCQCICQIRFRDFSSSPHKATRQRDDMYRWLNGPGKVFRKPLPGSTNYLNAYDQSGNLLRGTNDQTPKTRRKEKDDDAEEREEDAEAAEGGQPLRGIKEAQKPSIAEIPTIPKETAEDLMPFPMNRSFRSQAVLSEELKDAIWKRVMEDGKSVRDVSALLGVEMRRVAAVVRLKAVEKEWEKKVCLFSVAISCLKLSPVCNDEKTYFD